MRPRRVTVLAGALLIGGVMPLLATRSAPVSATAAAPVHAHIDCAISHTCADVAESDETFGSYVGHDEPSALFYSNKAGSGNRMQYDLTLPKDPSTSSPTTPGKSYQFELNGAFWFGMAMCDTQSYPEQISTCPADSDSNILDPAISNQHAGTAFTELQFYPPGWVPWPTWATAIGASGCDATHWCAALNIDSLSEDPVTGTTMNATCAGMVGLEYVNFAFITKNGVSTGPANPLNATLSGTFTPDPSKDLFMNSGDQLDVSMHDSSNGLVVQITDMTTGQKGSMTASAANGFGQMAYAPTGTSCTEIPYDFHPMYSTSSEQTRVIWAAHTYNIAFADEIGHFEFCNGTAVTASSSGSACPGGNTEGSGNDVEATDSDEATCFPTTSSSLIAVQGCTDQNNGFDGVPYHAVWPDGNTALHPQPIKFSSPRWGQNYDQQYDRVALEADLPAVEAPVGTGCSTHTGSGCTLIPLTDDTSSGTHLPAFFYPFFSTANSGGECVWQIGNHIPGNLNDFGQNQGYGTILQQTLLINGGTSGGQATTRFENFRQIFNSNPCRDTVGHDSPTFLSS